MYHQIKMLWQKMKQVCLYRGACIYLRVLSLLNGLKSLSKETRVIWENSYESQKIFLLALYEKGTLRSDIETLLAVAKRLDMYTVCVNTLKLDSPERYNGLIDCYVERYNFGRDFGSYKTGFLHLYKRQWEERCPRVLMLNDSIFYSQKELTPFMAKLLNTKSEVLGATENHETEHHLGSFCLSLDGRIIRKEAFRRYWKQYTNSDVRPAVIRRGEMGLSRMLRSCVSSTEKFSTLFDVTWFSEYINDNRKHLDQISNYFRGSDLVDWKRPSLRASAERVMQKYPLVQMGVTDPEAATEYKSKYFVDSISSLKEAIATSVKEMKPGSIDRRVYEEVKYDLLECFSQGSQIHQNALLLHYLGLPLIKLDGLYRGMFSTGDVEKLAQQLDPDEVIPFKRLVYSKPFGGEVLYGWKKTAFFHGLI